MKRREMLVTTGSVLAGVAARPWTTLAAAAIRQKPKSIFRAGAFAQDITPEHFPIVVGGHFKPRYADKVLDPLHARCLVMDDGDGQIAMVVVDSCVLDRPTIDEAKQLASSMTGIPAGRIFISATHTHSAPASVSLLTTDHDERYRVFVLGKIAEGIKTAKDRMVPAQVGWGVEKLPELAQSRRWIARPDKIKEDPFGEFTTRATMHPGYRNPDWQEPSGPMNPDVDVLALRRLDGSPIALLGSFSIHYVGAGILSADYFGVFANRIGELLGAGADQTFVGILANGVSGDGYLKDYTLEKQDKFDKHSIAEEVAQAALKAYQAIQWHAWLPLDVRESELELKVREPKLEWARKMMVEIKAGREKANSMPGVYAREQLLLSEMPATRKLKLQALRVGTLAMVGIPCEVFAITGLRINAQSPFAHTFTMMLANGYDGYLPPPEQMAMGGYTTWLARSSLLENEAETKIVAEVSRLLADLGKDVHIERKPTVTPYAAAVMASRPLVYWQMDDYSGPNALNAADGKLLGKFGMPTAYYMRGAQAPEFPGFGAENRVPHFIGAPLSAAVPGLGDKYTVEMWFYNCMPVDARSVTGYLFSRGGTGDHLAIGGTEQSPGKLIFHTGEGVKEAVAGQTAVPLRNWVASDSWHHVALVRDGTKIKVYLDGQSTPEISTITETPQLKAEVWIGGKGDGAAEFEGRIDEVALYARALSVEELQRHYRAALGV